MIKLFTGTSPLFESLRYATLRQTYFTTVTVSASPQKSKEDFCFHEKAGQVEMRLAWVWQRAFTEAAAPLLLRGAEQREERRPAPSPGTTRSISASAAQR